MMAWYPAPQLMQLLEVRPLGMWGVERFNRGYAGPMLRVRRADNVQKDCYSLADVVAHCGATSGWLTAAYDQSGNARDLAQISAGLQPKIFDSATGLIKNGPLVGISFLQPSGQYLSRLDNAGMPNGSPAITTINVNGVWANTSGTGTNPVQWWIGPDAFPVAMNDWYMGRTPTQYYVTARSAGINFTIGPENAATRCYWVSQKALNANMNTVTLRVNGTPLVPEVTTPGVMAMTSPGKTAWGCAMAGGGGAGDPSQPSTLNSSLLAHYNATFTAAELAAAERYMARMVS
jgi:hypothetical protein